MKCLNRAFTLIELLVVIAIIAILAAILFPVFAQAKTAAKKTVAISNFKQTATAAAMYTADYEGGLMMSNTGSLNTYCWGCGNGGDTVPAQQMLPYVKNGQINIDPMDPLQGEEARIKEHARDMTSQGYAGWTGTLPPERRAYASGVRSNIGYNYAFLSPWRKYYIGSNYYSGSASMNESRIASPAATLMWGTTIWNRDTSGNPKGGGNWIIETPCWEDANNVMLEPMKQYSAAYGDNTLHSYPNGWNNNANGWNVYGGLWPYYNQVDLSRVAKGLKDGHVVIGFADSHVQSKPVGYTVQGCSTYGTTQMKGNVTDKDKFVWDLD